MGIWVGTFVANDKTEFTPTDKNDLWVVGNEEIHQNAFAEFVDALRERGDMPPPPGLLSRQAFKEIQERLKTDLEVLATFIRENLDLDEPPAITMVIRRYLDGEDTDDLLSDTDDKEEDDVPPAVTHPPILTRPLNEL